MRNIPDSMPASIELEKTILGTSLVDSTVLAVAIEQLREDDLYIERHKELFKIMKEMVAQKITVDFVSLNDRLEITSRQDLQPTLDSVIGSVCSVESAEGYIEQISQTGTLRRLITVGNEISRLCYAYDGDIEDVTSRAEDMLYQAIEKQVKTNVKTMTDVMSATFDAMEKKHKGEFEGITTGLKSVDESIYGLESGIFYIIAGRPSMGKTSLALSMALQQSLAGIPVAFFTIEMPANQQIGTRLLSIASGVGIHAMRTMTMQKSSFQKISQVGGDIANIPLYFEEETMLSLNMFRTKLRKMKSKYGVKAVYIDYLQLMKWDGDNENLGIAKITRGLKLTAKEFDMPVVVLSQLTRSNEKRGKSDIRPKLSDLRGSGAIEQDADVVMFVHRDYWYDKEKYSADDATIIVAKQRNGPVEDIKMKFDPATTTFSCKEEL